MITVKNRDELIEILDVELRLYFEPTVQTKFKNWLENNTNLKQFVGELNKVWEHLTDIYNVHTKMTYYRDSDYVWDDYFELMNPKIQRIVDKTDFVGDWTEELTETV